MIFEYDSIEYNKDNKIISKYQISYTKLGNFFERNDKWNYLNKLNRFSKYNYTNFVYWKIFFNINSVLSNNGFLFKKEMINDLTIFGYKIYQRIKKSKDNRKILNINNITFITLYFSLKMKYIYISTKKLIKNCNINMNYRKLILNFYNYFPEINKLIVNNDFRQKYIINVILKYVNFKLSFKFLTENWNKLKILKNETIMIIILKYFINKSKYNLHKVCLELDLSQCSGNNGIYYLKQKNLFLK